MAQLPKGGLVRGHGKPMHGSCAIDPFPVVYIPSSIFQFGCCLNPKGWCIGTPNIIHSAHVGRSRFIYIYIILYYIVLYFIVLYYIILYCILLYYIILYCMLLYYIISFCIVLYFIVLYHQIYMMGGLE